MSHIITCLINTPMVHVSPNQHIFLTSIKV
jgi:hypothetical protein